MSLALLHVNGGFNKLNLKKLCASLEEFGRMNPEVSVELNSTYRLELILRTIFEIEMYDVIQELSPVQSLPILLFLPYNE